MKVTAESTPLFALVDGVRVPIHRANGQFSIARERLSAEELQSRIEAAPENFNANVLLRPVLQDYWLPTLAYIGGPAEVAYFAQVAVVYEKLLGADHASGFTHERDADRATNRTPADEVPGRITGAVSWRVSATRLPRCSCPPRRTQAEFRAGEARHRRCHRARQRLAADTGSDASRSRCARGQQDASTRSVVWRSGPRRLNSVAAKSFPGTPLKSRMPSIPGRRCRNAKSEGCTSMPITVRS